MLDAEGSARFLCTPLHLPMSEDRPSQLVTLSAYQLPWRDQFCFWLDAKPGKELLFIHLHDAFARTGGVPEHLLVRAIRPFGQTTKGEVVWQRSFERLCRHYGCRPLACKRPHPLWMKDVQQCLDSRDWATVAECSQALAILARSLSQGRMPDDQGLQPLPEQPFACKQEAACRVGADGFARYRGNFYSLPIWYAGRTLWARQSGDAVAFYTEDEHCICQHGAATGHGQVRLHVSHFESPVSAELSQAIQAWRTCFPAEERFLELLIAQRRLAAPQTLRAILALAHRVPRARLRSVLDQCRRSNNYSHRFVQGLLNVGEGAGRARTDLPLRTTAQQYLF